MLPNKIFLQSLSLTTQFPPIKSKIKIAFLLDKDIMFHENKTILNKLGYSLPFIRGTLECMFIAVSGLLSAPCGITHVVDTESFHEALQDFNDTGFGRNLG